MNKNPDRPYNIDEIISELLNPKEKELTEMELYKQKQKEIIDSIFN